MKIKVVTPPLLANVSSVLRLAVMPGNRESRTARNGREPHTAGGTNCAWKIGGDPGETAIPHCGSHTARNGREPHTAGGTMIHAVTAPTARRWVSVVLSLGFPFALSYFWPAMYAPCGRCSSSWWTPLVRLCWSSCGCRTLTSAMNWSCATHKIVAELSRFSSG